MRSGRQGSDRAGATYAPGETVARLAVFALGDNELAAMAALQRAVEKGFDTYASEQRERDGCTLQPGLATLRSRVRQSRYDRR